MSFHLGWRNLVFEETHPLDLGPGASIVTGELAALRRTQLADRVTLTASGTDTQLSIRIEDQPPDAAGRTIQLLALLDLDITLDGTFTDLQVRYDIGGTEPALGEPFPLPAFKTGFPRNAYILIPVPSDDVDIVRLYIEGTVVGSGTLTVSIGAIWTGQALELPIGPLRVRHIEQARGVVTPGGQRFDSDSVTLRELRFDAEHLTDAQAIGTETTSQDVQQAIQYAGGSQPVLVIPFAADEHQRHRLGVYGNFSNTGELIRRKSDSWQWAGAVVTEAR